MDSDKILDRFNEAFDRYAIPFCCGALIGFAACFFRFVW